MLAWLLEGHRVDGHAKNEIRPLAPGKDGMVHISKLADRRVEKVEDVVNIGDMIWVKVTDIDEKGRVNLSYKDALKEIKAKKEAGEPIK